MSTGTESRNGRASARNGRRRVVFFLLAVAAAVALIPATGALADSPIQNPYFKDRGSAGVVNAGTDLSGWTTSVPGQVISTYCYTGRFPNLCQPEPGTTIPVLGFAGSPAPSQEYVNAATGTPGYANFRKLQSTDIYNTDAEWLAERPLGTLINQQSNYALVPTSCSNGQPAPNELSQSFYAHKDQVLTGFSFFTSQDWVPDSGTVTVTAPGGSPEPVFRGRIIGDNDANPAGPWDHPVLPTVHKNNRGDWVKPHGELADSAWVDAHYYGVSGTPWTRWTYRFPEDGTYTITASAKENDNPSFYVDCKMPSMLGLQFQTPTPIKDGLTVATTPASTTYGDAPFSIAGNASVYASRTGEPNPTGKGVQFSTTDPDCTVTSAGMVTIKKVGDGVCNVTVRAPGNFYFYAPEAKKLAITIDPASLYVDAPDVSKTYGTPNPDPNDSYDPLTSLRGFVNDDDAGSVGLSGNPSCSIDPDAGPDAGSYAGAVHCVPGTLNAAPPSAGDQPNYVVRAGNDGTLTIAKADQAIDLPAIGDRTLGDPDVDPGAKASSGLPVQYASTSEGVCTISGDGKVRIQHAGTCVVAAAQPGNGNYNAAEPVIRVFNVAKADQTISFAPLSNQRFGDPDPTADAHASSGLDVSFLSLSPDVCTVDPVSGAIHVVAFGTCAILASQGGNDDYNAAQDVLRTFEVATASQAITFPAPPDKTYGDEDIDLADLDATASSGLDVGYAAEGDCVIVNGKLRLTGAGQCTITATQDGDRRYEPAAAAQRTFTIHKAPLTIMADDASRRYGNPNPDLTFSTSGLVNGDTLASATSGAVECSSSAHQGSDAGAYPIACTGDVSSRNYDVDFAPGTLTVTKAPLTVKADDAARRYGEADPAFSYSLGGFVNGDTRESATTGAASCSSAATPASNAGSYPINCVAGDLQASNYELDFSPGTLTVTKAPLTIKADDASRRYGEANPAFTYSPSGLLNGDTLASATTGTVNCSSPAGQASDVGDYPITCDGDVTARNYHVGFAPGMLTVGKANQSITFGPLADKFYGQEDFNANAAATSGLAVTYAAQGACTVNASTGAVHLLLPGQWPGTCTITASQGGSGNYNAAAPVSRSFKILTAALDGGGIFTIGNLNATVGRSVTWWGSQWWKQNSLTGGTGPAEFKGFIDSSPSYPPRCGDTWTTRPGNSSKPPAKVPEYMTVVVSSRITKSGSTISGDIKSVVVVKTNSGYASDPGHAGMGTVVATLCG